MHNEQFFSSTTMLLTTVINKYILIYKDFAYFNLDVLQICSIRERVKGERVIYHWKGFPVKAALQKFHHL